MTYSNVTVASAGDYRLELNTTSGGALSVSVNGAAPRAVDRPDSPAATAISVPLQAGANTIKVFSSQPLALDRIAVAPLPPASYVPRTTMTVEPHGVQWVGPGQQSLSVTATLRLDVDDPISGVKLAPIAPAGWTVTGDAVTTPTLRLGQTITGKWTLTSPPNVTPVTAPVTASFEILGRAKQVTTNVQVRPRPADRVFMREAEDFANTMGSTGLTGCGPCSGGEKVRNIGGAPEAAVTFGDVKVDTAGQYTLFIDFTVNGPRSFFVSVNGGAPVQVAVDGQGNNTPYVTSIPVTLNAGANTIKFHNDKEGAPDLDRISLR